MKFYAFDSFKGLPEIKGVDAKWFVTFNGTTPQKGGIVLLKYGEVWHTAYIEKILEKGVWVSETNYKKGQYTERLIEWGDKNVVKYLYL